MKSEHHKKYLIVVAGPTAVGKTGLCINLAHHFNTEIVSADSRQFYREMNIGTAKPSEEELAEIKHHFINSLSIQDNYNAGDYEKDALIKINEIFKRNPIVILTGGSGLYIQAVCDGLNAMPEVPEKVREKLNNRYRQSGLDDLLQELKERDPQYYNRVDRNNPQRIIRALEVCIATGKSYSLFRNSQQKKVVKRPFTIIKVGLERNRNKLYERIDRRMNTMIDQGLFEEATALYPLKRLNALQTVGYKEIFDYMDGQYDKEEAIRLLKRNSRRYAKRQLTWFKKEEYMVWFHPNEVEEIVDYIKLKAGK